MNRGRNQDTLFIDNTDYSVFIDLLQEAGAIWKIKIAAYCLMSNHYHLLVQTPQANLDRCMRHINGIYTQRFNRRYKMDGQLFRGRYKAILVDADNYLLELVRYIHRNPVRAGIVRQPEEYLWSSHRGYLAKSDNWKWLQKEFVLGMFDENKAGQKEAFLNFIGQGDSKDIQKFYEKKNLPSFLGSEGFIEKIKAKYFGIKKHKEVPQSKHLEPTIEDIRRIVSSGYKVQKESLSKMRRGFYNEARDVAVYLSRLNTGKKLNEIGAAFNIANYSTVSSIIANIRNRSNADKELTKRLREIDQLLKGQRQI
jgi:REP element-mobilizing transposase RayT